MTGGIIVGAKSFTSNVYDGDTLEEILSQVKAVRGIAPETAFVTEDFAVGSRSGKQPS